MTEGEARQLMKSYGWTWMVRKRGRNTPYLYAERRGENQKKQERYIIPLAKLSELTEIALVSKLMGTSQE